MTRRFTVANRDQAREIAAANTVGQPPKVEHVTPLTYTIAGDRCDCGEPLDYCYWCDRRTPACPACGQETTDAPVCYGEDGNCSPREES